jgi:hypothetical protein
MTTDRQPLACLKDALKRGCMSDFDLPVSIVRDIGSAAANGFRVFYRNPLMKTVNGGFRR